MLSFGTMAQVKLGFVDTQRLLDTMPSRKVAFEKYQAYEQELTEEFNMLRAELEKMYSDYELKKNDMTPVIRQQTEKKIMDKERILQERQQTIPQDLQQYSDELYAPILDKVQKAIKTVAELQKLTLVVDQTTTLFFDASMDITNTVAKELMKMEAAQ